MRKQPRRRRRRRKSQQPQIAERTGTERLVGLLGLAVLSLFLLYLAFRVTARPPANFAPPAQATQREAALPASPSPPAEPAPLEKTAPPASPSPISPPQPARAALVDQVALTVPNPEFVQATLHHLQTAGFQTDLYSGDNVTVDFYRTLPSKGYKLIVLRTHSTSQIVQQIRSADDLQEVQKEKTMRERVGLFTSERYSEARWLPEQLRAEVGGGSLPYGDQDALYFGINSDYVRNRMVGRFDDSLIIIAGCQSLAASDMAEALVERGASVVIGWNEWVDSDRNDRALGRLLQALLDEGRTVEGAVAVTMAEVGPDPVYQSVLTHYPQDRGDRTVKDQVLRTVGQRSAVHPPIDPAGINCGADCTETYDGGTVATLTARPGVKSYLASWSGDCSGTGLTTTVTMDADKTCTAPFGYPVVVVPVNKLGLVSPWMGLVGLASLAALTVALVRRRRAG